jgi:hypothetical protein
MEQVISLLLIDKNFPCYSLYSNMEREWAQEVEDDDILAITK